MGDDRLPEKTRRRLRALHGQQLSFAALHGQAGMTRDGALEFAASHRDRFLETLFQALAIPSISAQGIGVLEGAEFLIKELESAGFNARLFETRGQPVVFGEVSAARSNAPTVLFYGHYDVQPAEPLDLWASPPFEPVIRNDRVYGRGTADNKGQHLAHVFAVEAYQQTVGGPPVNVKIVLEGEEESGSPHMDAFVQAHPSLLACDCVYTADGGFDRTGRPIVCLGVRGTIGVELSLRTAARDVHSGNFGNLVSDPARRMAELITSMHDDEGRISIEGFYDDVRPPTESELELCSALPYDPDALASELGLSKPLAKTPVDYGRAIMFEPTCTVTGISSGYTGEGMKTIVPGRAIAKLDFRLVADQRPPDIFTKVKSHVLAHDREVEVRAVGAMRPSRSSPGAAVVHTIVGAVRDARGSEPIVVPALGGSLPDAVWTQTLGVPSVIVPYANHDAANHAPNENLRLDAFFAGIDTTIWVLDALAHHSGAPDHGDEPL
jgi:acetylornithine deacetylase/succinyl-diaminopimelate desuccinylase-like protein